MPSEPRDPHTYISPTEARRRGCTCEFGCRSCGEHESRMGNCPAFHPCPMGRAEDPNCPLMKESAHAE
jgi:hypothetical protein